MCWKVNIEKNKEKIKKKLIQLTQYYILEEEKRVKEIFLEVHI